MIRRGDWVTWQHRGLQQLGIIHQWSGHPDSWALIVTAQRTTARKFVHSLTPAPAVSDAMREEMATYLASKAGKQLILDARSPAMGHLDRRGRVIRVEGMPDPGKGAGAPELADVPLRLADGMTSNLSKQMVRRLQWLPQYEAALIRLATRNPLYFQVWVAHMHHDKRLRDIARDLEITPERARQAKHRAHRIVLEGELAAMAREYEHENVTVHSTRHDLTPENGVEGERP